MMARLVIILFLLLPVAASAQVLEGTVTDVKKEALSGVTLRWEGINAGTFSDEAGNFEIPIPNLPERNLIVSFAGYSTDTVRITDQTRISIVLQPSSLDEVVIKGNRQGIHISTVDPIKSEVITKLELKRAACCDLAGCFGTQGTVQPTTTNIVTNAKELRILGLSGVYNQVLIDGMPLIQGLTYTYGISSIPGTLVDNIYVAKGANSVLQGFESISGQINVLLKEPNDTDKLLLNAYLNSFLESQYNVNYSHKWKDWSTLVAAHSTQPARKIDRDDDGFLDLPQLTRYSFYNKWQYRKSSEWGWHSRIGLRYVDEERIGGQVNFNPKTDEGTLNTYGQTVRFSQPELYTKTGYRMDDRHHFVGFVSAFHQDQSSYYGTTAYKANQTNVYANLQYELTWKEQHTLKTGFSYRHLRLKEDLSFIENPLNRTFDGLYDKEEHIPGVFAENTFNWKDQTLSLITGIRLDHHNTFGWQVTPRALFKVLLTENTTARVSAGTGWRTINLFSENINLLASSRNVVITETLNPERALNTGANLTHKIFGENIEAQFTFDFYHTRFFNQVFPDYDTDPTAAFISNFTGKSISNGFQAEAGFEFFDRLGTKLVYNYLDVYRVVNGEKFVLPFNSTHRFTGTLAYVPKHEKWHFDMNVHVYGPQRLAKTLNNPPEFQLPEYSRTYGYVNAQITKNWEKFEVYVGCENIFDFRQRRPILSWENPFGPYFDTSSVWGPTRGREMYVGVRFTVE